MVPEEKVEEQKSRLPTPIMSIPDTNILLNTSQASMKSTLNTNVLPRTNLDTNMGEDEKPWGEREKKQLVNFISKEDGNIALEVNICNRCTITRPSILCVTHQLSHKKRNYSVG